MGVCVKYGRLAARPGITCLGRRKRQRKSEKSFSQLHLLLAGCTRRNKKAVWPRPLLLWGPWVNFWASMDLPGKPVPEPSRTVSGQQAKVRFSKRQPTFRRHASPAAKNDATRNGERCFALRVRCQGKNPDSIEPAMITKMVTNTTRPIRSPVEGGNFWCSPPQKGHTDFFGTGVQLPCPRTRGGPVMIRGIIFFPQ